MSSQHELTTPGESLQPTDARFTIRSLLKLTVLVALVATLISPVVKRLEPAEQVRLIVFWAGCLVVAAAWIAYQSWRRQQAERLAGPSLLKLSMFDDNMPQVSWLRGQFNIWAPLFIWGVFFMSASLSMAAVRPAGPDVMFSMLFALCVALVGVRMIGRTAARMWWRNAVRFCEHGVLWDHRVLLWNHLANHEWTGKLPVYLELMGLDQYGSHMSIKLVVPPQDERPLKGIIEEKLAERRLPRIRPLAYDVGRAPGKERYLQPVMLRLLYITAIDATIIGVMIWVVFGNAAGVSGFQGWAIAGLVSNTFTRRRRRWIAAQSGRPMVRLKGWRNNGRVVLCLAIAAVCFLVASRWSLVSDWIVPVAGVAFGFFMWHAITPAFRQCDLCENGVLLKNEVLWEWSHLTASRWRSDSSDCLILARSWRRMIVAVPRDQRAAVSQLLEARLPGLLPAKPEATAAKSA